MTDSIRFASGSSLSLVGILTKNLISLGLVYLIVMSSYVEGSLNPILL